MSIKIKYHKVIQEKVNSDGTISFTLRYDFQMFKQAACHGINTELFYPVGESDVPAHIIQRVCNSCPIKEACLEWGLAHERFGTWGGTTARVRNAMRKLNGLMVNDISLYPSRLEFAKPKNAG